MSSTINIYYKDSITLGTEGMNEYDDYQSELMDDHNSTGSIIYPLLATSAQAGRAVIGRATENTHYS